MKTPVIFTILLFASTAIWGQPCSEIISRSEEYYRNGQFNNIKDVARCLGVYKPNDEGGISRDVKKLIAGLRKYEEEYAHLLGDFRNFSSVLESAAVNKSDRDAIFSIDERQRAYMLLGKTYETLGALKIAELFAQRLLVEHPTFEPQDEENPYYQEIFEDQRRRTLRFSAGPLVGWGYFLPYSKTVNRAGKPQFKSNFKEGNIIIALGVNYLLNDSWTLCLNGWGHNSIIEYTERGDAGSEQVSFYHEEKQVWMKLPLFLRLSGEKYRWLRSSKNLEAQFFFQGGLSLNYLTAAEATIADLEKELLLYELDVVDTRNRFNYDGLLGVGSRFRFGRNYITVSFQGSMGFKNVLDQASVGSENNSLFRQHGVVENNYRLWSVFYLLSYEIRFNKIKK